MVVEEDTMKVIIFDVKGKVAHFRRPDTTSTQLTYPFITPTAVKGLVGAILGIEDFITNDKIGIQVLNPVRAVAQQMSMLGKDSGSTFNRPTTIELLVNPAYRIYYMGEEYGEQLASFLQKQHAVYPTYLGSAYALTKPILYDIRENVRNIGNINQPIQTKTVIPTRIIRSLQFQQDRQYSRAGGFLRFYKGDRTFEQSIDFIYEQEGKSISFILDTEALSSDIQLIDVGGEAVCLF
jgi:CRISPR-associated protein Cas5h